MIVRISNEGQYDVADADVAALNELDNAAVAACAMDDEAAFRAAFEKLLNQIRTEGRPVGDGYLGASDLILPPADISLEEAKAEFRGDGLLPG